MSELQAQQPSNVRFRSTARLTEEAMREVTACSLRPRTFFAHVWTALCVCLGLLFLYWGWVPYAIALIVAAVALQIAQRLGTKRTVRLLVEREQEMERQMPDVFTSVREHIFTDERIESGKTSATYDYASIQKVLTSEHYVILFLKGGLFLLVDKANLQGGTVVEFLQFIDAKRKG